MSKTSNKVLHRKRIHRGLRAKIKGTAQKPRLSVYRSNKEIYAQLIDDINGETLSAANSRQKDLLSVKGTKTEIAEKVGEALAQKATEAGIETCVFDRSGYPYHGRVKALADGARKGGLEI